MELKSGEEWIKKYARVGIFAKGVVYILVGGLATFAAFNIGGKASGKSGAFQFVLSQPMGKIMLALIALGLIGYVVWRMIQTFKNPEDKGFFSRVGYFSSGLFYALISFTAAQMIFTGGGGDSSGKQQYYISTILDETWGQIAIAAVSLIFFGRAIYHLYRALSGNFAKKLDEIDLNQKARQVLIKAGLVGYIARAVVIGVIGFLFMKAAWQANSSETGGTEKAFELLQQSVAGPVLLGIVALGLVAYGIFMIVKARYRVLPSL